MKKIILGIVSIYTFFGLQVASAKPATEGSELRTGTLEWFIRGESRLNYKVRYTKEFKDFSARMVEGAIGGACVEVSADRINGLSPTDFDTWKALQRTPEIRRAKNIYRYEAWRLSWDKKYRKAWDNKQCDLSCAIKREMEVDILYNRDMVKETKIEEGEKEETAKGLKALKVHSSKMDDLLDKVDKQKGAIKEILMNFSLKGKLRNKPIILTIREAAYQATPEARASEATSGGTSSTPQPRRRYINGQWRTLVNGDWT